MSQLSGDCLEQLAQIKIFEESPSSLLLAVAWSGKSGKGLAAMSFGEQRTHQRFSSHPLIKGILFAPLVGAPV